MWARLRFERGRLALGWRTSAAVEERLRFLSRELLGRRYTRTYRLRDSSLRMVIRHPIVDLWVVHEVFAAGEYEIPAEARERLAHLDHPVRVLDLGGNIGLFGLYVHREMKARVVSFEPDPRNAASLRRCMAANPDLQWELVPAAAGTRAGQTRFISDFGLSQVERIAADYDGHATRDRWLPPSLHEIYPSTPTVLVSVVDVMPYLAECDLLKVDIEGAEWDLLADPRFAATSAVAVVLEAHAHRGRESDAQAAIRRAFGSAGLEQLAPWVGGRQANVIWAIRP